MCQGSKKVFMAIFLFICLTLVMGSVSQAFVTYYGAYAPFSNVMGNPGTGAYANMQARAMGAYAFTDYASAWGLANLGQMGMVTGLSGLGMGLGGLSAVNMWNQSYPAAPMYGYGSSYMANPWLNYSGSSYLGANAWNYPFSGSSYPLNTYSYPSSSLYNSWTGYSPFNSWSSVWDTDDDEEE